MTSPVERISGPSSGIDAGEAGEREDGFLDRDMRAGCAVRLAAIGGEGLVQRLAGHDAGGDLGDRLADGLGDKRHGARGARVDFEDVDRAVLDGELDVHQAADIQRLGQRRRLAFELVDGFGRQRVDRQRAGAVARMDAGFLDMLHDAGDEDVLCRPRGSRHRPRLRR